MGLRGPKSSKIKVLEPIKIRRPNPPRGMTKPARTVWLRIVRAYPPDHFKPQHFDLLRSYSESCALNKKATKELSRNGYCIENLKTGVIKESPWVGIMEKTAGKIASLSVKLKLNVLEKNPGKAKKPKSRREGLLGGTPSHSR